MGYRVKLLTRKRRSETVKLFNKHFEPQTESQLVLENNFICIYKTDKKPLGCDGIIDHAEKLNIWNDSEVVENLAGKSVSTKGAVVPENRDCKQACFLSWESPEEHRKIFEFFQSSLTDYLKRFPHANTFPAFLIREHYNIIKYEAGQAFHSIHSDYYPFGFLSRRHLTGIAFLNDVEKGGELYFPHQDLTVKAEVGKMLIFPSGWTHVHKTFPPIDQKRYVFQVWWSFETDDSQTESG